MSGGCTVKLVFVIKRPLSPRDAERCGIRPAAEAGHDVRVLDVSRPTHPVLPWGQEGVWTHPNLSITVVESWSALKSCVEMLRQADLIVLFNQSFGLSRATLPVLRAVARSGTPYLVVAPAFYGAVAAPQAGAAGLGRIGNLWRRLRQADMLNSIIARIPPPWLGVPAARFVVYNGLASMVANSLVGPATEPIYAVTADYDRAAQVAPAGAEPMALFLDQYIPFHPDTKVLKLGREVDPEHYYASLRALFDRVEAELGLRVVIALHPRADYSNRPGILSDREMIANQTPELIARSRLVLTHVSTAIGMVVMFRKPVLLIVTRDHYDLSPTHGPMHEQLARTLNTKLQFIDDPAAVDLSSPFMVDDDCYDRYVATYLRHPRAEGGRRLWDMVLGAAARSLGIS